VLLLDEIEKAHNDLVNILLQVMDHGTLTDHNGKKVDFRNVILIMTTNAGAADLARQPIGFNRTKREGDDEEAINRMFTPEFRNRLDSVIGFSSLSQEVIAKVVEKFIFELEAQLQDRNVTIELTESANSWLAQKGFDEKFGARPLARVIQEYIKRPLADELLFGKLKDGGVVRVIVEKKDGVKILGFEFLEGPAAKSRPGGSGKGGKGSPRKGAAKKPTKGRRGPVAKSKSSKPRPGKPKPKKPKSRGSSTVPKVPLPAK
jgi:ATP-dependent Clp protease ATP-binding subunit ClpA